MKVDFLYLGGGGLGGGLGGGGLRTQPQHGLDKLQRALVNSSQPLRAAENENKNLPDGQVQGKVHCI